MQRLITMFSIGLLLGSGGLLFAPHADAATSPVRFGMDAASIAAQTQAGVKPDFATVWVGPWTLKSGWSGVDATLLAMRSAGITPAVHLYYWGGDISRDCLQNGCWSHVHQVWKDRAGWDRLTDQLVSHLNAKMGGKQVVVFLESEFNNGDVQTYETLDWHLKTKAERLHNGYGNTKVVLSLGNWNRGHWSTWDRAAAASDAIGIQGLRGSTRDSWSTYHGLYEDTLAGVKKARSLFGRPIFIQDIGLSTYPEPAYARAQTTALKEFFGGLPALKAAGVEAILYRSWADDPKMNLREYYGPAERHWGLTYAWGSHKSAAKVWIDGVKGERAGATASRAAASSADVSFTLRSIGNPWWVDVKVDGAPTSVSARVDAGGWIPLQRTSWGTWAKSFHVPAGSVVQFQATDRNGHTATSPAYDWATGATGDRATSGFTATFTPRSAGNPWWVEAKVASASGIRAVEARVDDRAWVRLDKTAWGTWAKSFHVPAGSEVTFRATDTAGQRAVSTPNPWGDADFDARFHAKGLGNAWWVEAAVTGSQPIQRVDVRIDGGAWTALHPTSWGTWAKSLYVRDDAGVVFRATEKDGSTETSGRILWR